jgi:hypothetical protein
MNVPELYFERNFTMRDFCQPTPCPKCGEPNLIVHTLGDGKIGIWCDSCLAGIPNRDISAGETIEEAISNFELYENSLNSGKIR